jgi:glycerol-3-phosphate dehydrogenase (NAD(P)+)
MSNVTIVGAGMMGTAMAWPLSDNGHHVRLVGTHLDTEIIASCLKKRCHPRLRRRLPNNVQPYYHVFLSTDVIGVEVCVALKNAYALAVGLAGGLLERLGGPDEAEAQNHNPAAALFGASAKEMARLVSLLGANPAMVTSLPGVGDHYVTCMGGRTVRLGRLLGKGLNYEQARAELAGETLESAFVVAQIAKALPGLEAQELLGRDELPLMRCLCRVITENAPADVDFDRLFQDDLK